MFKSYKLLTMTVNINGGENETIEHLYKEENGKLVPMTNSEAIFKLSKDFSTIGGNDKTKAIKCMLFDTNGDLLKTEFFDKEQTK